MNGSVTINSDGTLFYVPNVGYIGTDMFTYTVTNDIGGSDTATVTVTMTAAVFAMDDDATADGDSAVTIPVLANDIGATMIFSYTQPSHGSVMVSGNSLIYTPAPNHVGADSFEYTIAGGQMQTDTATVNVL